MNKSKVLHLLTKPFIIFLLVSGVVCLSLLWIIHNQDFEVYEPPQIQKPAVHNQPAILPFDLDLEFMQADPTAEIEQIESLIDPNRISIELENGQ
ncbi:MAG TPA: hypothetical protein ENN77_00185 [Candidatus Wirthbacteria bacterium]|nr:hypothetical protein [Candidatus Wirthbacteria bacterium]